MAKTKRKKILWAIDPYGEAKVQASAFPTSKIIDGSSRRVWKKQYE